MNNSPPDVYTSLARTLGWPRERAKLALIRYIYLNEKPDGLTADEWRAAAADEVLKLCRYHLKRAE